MPEESITCRSLPSAVVTSFIGTMNRSDSFHTFSSISVQCTLCAEYPPVEYARPPRYTTCRTRKLAVLSDPGGTHLFLPLRIRCYCLRPRSGYRLPLFQLTRLNHFTLSHYGSLRLLPTLKPNLTVSAPRLDSSGWLDLTVSDSHRLDI